MIQFEKAPIQTLNATDGTLIGGAPRPTPPNIGMDNDEFEKQAIDLANKKVPLQKALIAIEKHPGITDKQKAADMLTAIYKIMGIRPSSNR